MTDSTKTLRRAAALMRERAEVTASTGAQWNGSHYWVEDYDPSDPSGQTSMQVLRGGMDAPDCDHYSSWHPDVALAVAGLLDAQAAICEEHGAFFDIEVLRDACALAVARTYLGESA